MFQAERFVPRVPRNDIDVVARVAQIERRKKVPATGAAFLRGIPTR